MSLYPVAHPRRQGGYLLPIVLFTSAAILIFVAAAYAVVMRQLDDVRRLGATGDFAVAKVSAKAEVFYRLMTEPATAVGIGINPKTAIRADNLNFDDYFEKVWRWIPKLTSSSFVIVERLTNEFTDPKSQGLIEAAAKIITDQVDLLVAKLLEANALRRNTAGWVPNVL